MADGDINGFDDTDTMRIGEVVRYVEHDPRYRRRQRRWGGPPPNDKLVLFVALENFNSQSASVRNCRGSTDDLVGSCARLAYDPATEANGWIANQSYFRVDGAVECVWDPGFGSPAGTSCGGQTILCGQRLWAQLNGTSGRYEVASVDRRTLSNGSGCACTWFGYATWIVTVDGDGNPQWTLESNRCTGCYDEGERTPALVGGLVDYRFQPLGLNADWITSPTPIPTLQMFEDGLRYATCCNAVDAPPDPGCELTCCYRIPTPIPSCPSGDESTVDVTVSLNSDSSGSGSSCGWSNTTPSTLLTVAYASPDCPGCRNTDTGLPTTCYLTVTRTGIYMNFSGVTMIYTVSWEQGGFGFVATVTAVYTLDSEPDCIATSATLSTVFAIVTVDGVFVSSSFAAICSNCNLGNDYFASIFETNIDLTPIGCDGTQVGRCCYTDGSGNHCVDGVTLAYCDTLPSSCWRATVAGSPTCADGNSLGCTNCVPSSSSSSSSTSSSSMSSSSSFSSSSSSTPCSGGPCGWTWGGTSWSQTSGACMGCTCPSPDFFFSPGTNIGATASTNCA